MENSSASNRKIESCKGFCRTVRRAIYPNIDFNLYHNNRYEEKDYLDVLTHMAMNQDFTNNGSQTFKLQRDKSPSGHNLLYHVGRLSKPEIVEMFDNIFETVYKMGRSKNAFDRTMDVAIDLTDWLYYGDKNDPMVVGARIQRGTKYAYRFATITIVVDGRRFTLLTLPVGQFGLKAKIVEELIAYAKKRIRIRTVYLDRGFNSVAIINTLERLGVKYIMPLQITNVKRKRLVEESGPNTVLDYTMKSGETTRSQYGKQANFKLCIVKSTKNPEKNIVFATNLDVDERNVEILQGAGQPHAQDHVQELRREAVLLPVLGLPLQSVGVGEYIRWLADTWEDPQETDDSSKDVWKFALYDFLH